MQCERNGGKSSILGQENRVLQVQLRIKNKDYCDEKRCGFKPITRVTNTKIKQNRKRMKKSNHCWKSCQKQELTVQFQKRWISVSSTLWQKLHRSLAFRFFFVVVVFFFSRNYQRLIYCITSQIVKQVVLIFCYIDILPVNRLILFYHAVRRPFRLAVNGLLSFLVYKFFVCNSICFVCLLKLNIYTRLQKKGIFKLLIYIKETKDKIRK